VGVRGLRTEFATGRSQSGSLETRAKLAKPDSHLRRRFLAAGADLEMIADRGERLVLGKTLPPLPARSLRALELLPGSGHCRLLVRYGEVNKEPLHGRPRRPKHS